jgi:hypothetical protein
MSLTTTNYKLFKPELSDPADITKMNPNWDILDEKLHTLNTQNVNLNKRVQDVEAELLGIDGGCKSYLGVITTNWTEVSTTGVKYQTVSISEVTQENTAKVDTVNTHARNSEGYALYVEEQNQFLDYITNGDAETVSGGVKFYIFGEANTVDIPIIVEVS